MARDHHRAHPDARPSTVARLTSHSSCSPCLKRRRAPPDVLARDEIRSGPNSLKITGTFPIVGPPGVVSRQMPSSIAEARPSGAGTSVEVGDHQPVCLPVARRSSARRGSGQRASRISRGPRRSRRPDVANHVRHSRFMGTGLSTGRLALFAVMSGGSFVGGLVLCLFVAANGFEPLWLGVLGGAVFAMGATGLVRAARLCYLRPVVDRLRPRGPGASVSCTSG